MDTTSDTANHAPSSPSPCGVESCAQLVSGKWTLLIVRDLIDGPRFFTELESSLIGMSPRTLCDRLKLLMQHDLVSRTRINGVPPRSVYELTARGHALIPIIDAMREAGETLRSLPMQLVGDDADAACCD